MIKTRAIRGRWLRFKKGSKAREGSTPPGTNPEQLERALKGLATVRKAVREAFNGR